jgi:TonB family protein
MDVFPKWLFAAALTGSLSVTTAPMAANAMQSNPSLAADSCVTYREDGSGGYRLANSCDYPIEIAFCSEPKSEPGLCLRTQGWMRERLNAGAQGLAPLPPEQALDLFACRQPGMIEILPSGMARCTAAPPEPVIPILLTASLKNPGAIITDKDYPASQHSKEGTTRFDLMVGRDGRPVSCTTTVSSGHVELDKAACNAFVRRARFSPAKDGSGNPVTGRYRGSVTWKAP